MRRTNLRAGFATAAMLPTCAAALLAGLAAVSSADADVAAGGGDMLPPPHQVEAVVRPVDYSGDALDLDSPVVVVALGVADNGPRPRRDGLESWTLIGTNGTMRASLLELTKICTYFDDDDEMESCRYEAHLTPSGRLDSIGTPAAALPGEFAFSEFSAIPGEANASAGFENNGSSPVRPVPDSGTQGEGLDSFGDGSSARGTHSDPAAGERDAAASLPALDREEFTEPIWPEGNPERSRSRLVRKDDGYVFEYAWGNAGPFEMRAGRCAAVPRGPLTRIRCETIEALFDGETMLLAAVADYAGPAADVHATLAHAGRTYLLLRFSLKAQTIWGLLYQDDDGAWHALIRPRDYALLC